MTKARLGSQVPLAIPAKSRKCCTFAGSTIRETTSPAPNNSPDSKAANTAMSRPQQMMRHEHDGSSARHEHHGRDQGTRRQSRDPADAVAAGAAGAEARAIPDQQPGDR